MRLNKMLGVMLMIGLVTAPAHFARAVDDAILAVVNEEVITVKDLKEYMRSVYAQLKIEGRSPQEISDVMTQYESKGIEQLIEDRLILSAAEKAGVLIRPKAVDERIEEIKKKYPTYQAFLESINKEGLTITEIRKKIEAQIKGQAMVSTQVRAKVYVNPQEVTTFYAAHAQEFSNKARVYIETIFVKSVFGKDEARVKIDNALTAVKGGADFTQAIATYSELPSVGEISLDQLRPEFKDRIEVMKVDDISDVIEVPNGFYIIKLKGRADASTASLKDVKDRIYQNLFESKFRERFKAWIDGLRKKAYVEVKQ
ncbi:MAG: peptidyl-prolyl cis-trans isomerase [Candidatus Omnitrophica bacterium]|nr:peptidyl-prolyl cis-trans isomerase [Candidatus Omnitrophota bacterium]